MLGFKEVAQRFRNQTGRELTGMTFNRWIRRGVKAGDSRVRLPAQRIGSRFFIPAGGLEQFLLACDCRA